MLNKLRFKVLAVLITLCASLFGLCAKMEPAAKPVKVTPIPHKPAYSLEDVAAGLQALKAKVDSYTLRIERLEMELAATRCKCECRPDCCKEKKPAPAVKPAPKKAPAPAPVRSNCPGGVCPSPSPSRVIRGNCPGGVCPSPSRSRTQRFGRGLLWR